MKNLIIVILSFFLSLIAFGQEVDFSTYDRIVTRGKVTIASHNQEYRMIVGSLKKPRISLLLGDAPELAIGNLNRLIVFAKNRPETVPEKTKVSFVFCGELFSLSFTGPESNRVIAFEGLNSPGRFSLRLMDLEEIKQEILSKSIIESQSCC